MTEAAAVEDFLRRIAHYATAYSPLDEDGSEGDAPYIKVAACPARPRARIFCRHY
jgi:hypothetical protein